MSLQPVTVACIQAQVRTVMDAARPAATIRENVFRNVSYVEFFSRHTNRGPKIVGLPELFLQGHNILRSAEDYAALALDLPGPEVQPLLDACAKYTLYVAGTCIERASAGWYHTAFVLGPHGVEVAYRQRTGALLPGQLPGEASLLPPVVDTPYGRVSCLFGDDLESPEPLRVLALRGAEIVLLPIYEPYNERQEARDALRKTRAYENSVYLISINQGVAMTPPDDSASRTWDTLDDLPVEAGLGFDSRGRSQVIDYTGRILFMADGNGETMITSPLDIGALRRYRAERGEPVVGGRDLAALLPALTQAASDTTEMETAIASGEYGSSAIAPLT